MYSVDSIASDNDECFWALDVIQDYTDDEWNECIPIIQPDYEKRANQVNYTCLEEQTIQIVPDKSCHSMYEYLVDRAFLHNVMSALSEGEAKDILFTRSR